MCSNKEDDIFINSIRESNFFNLSLEKLFNETRNKRFSHSTNSYLDLYFFVNKICYIKNKHKNELNFVVNQKIKNKEGKILIFKNNEFEYFFETKNKIKIIEKSEDELIFLEIK